MSPRARRWAWIGIGLVVVGALVGSLWPRGGSESIVAHTRRVAGEFRCVDCEGLSVADSATASARDQRRDIATRIRRGESDAEIRQVYVDRLGESILLNPASRGVGLIVWGLPIAAFILGAIGLGFALRRWQRQPRLSPTDADIALVNERRAESRDG